MPVIGIGPGTSPMLQAIANTRTRLDDLQRQFGSGIKADTYAGLGIDRGLTVGLRSQLSALTGYQQTITLVNVRLELMQSALSQFSSVALGAKSTILRSPFNLGSGGQTVDQAGAVNTLDQLTSALNVAADGRYLFAGRDVDQPPVETTDHILNGDGLKAGLRQVIDERRQADLGADGLGRLTLGAPSATAVSLAEDAVSPFGFKLSGAASTIPGATVSGPSGTPAALTFDLGASNPDEGQTATFTFDLPDGSSATLTLTATTETPPGKGQFTIGATPADTATNLRAALSTGLHALAGSELAAASAVAAGENFFDTDADHPPQRVGGSPPFYNATALVDGTTANTVQWYKGDAAAGDPRATAVAQADQAVSVGYGARANEEALRTAVQNVAVFAAVSFSGSDPDAAARYGALQQRLAVRLGGNASQQQVSDIGAELATVQVTLRKADERHAQSDVTLKNLLNDVQGVTQEEVATQILTLQTSLQASLQTTAMLLQTSILNYL